MFCRGKINDGYQLPTWWPQRNFSPSSSILEATAAMPMFAIDCDQEIAAMIIGSLQAGLILVG